MKMVKKLTATVIAAATILSLTACGENTTIIATNNGKEIPAGVYLMNEISAYTEATYKMTEEDKSVWDITIEDKTAEQFVRDKTDDAVKEFAAVEDEFERLGLTLDELTQDNISSQVDYAFGSDESADRFAKLGIGEVSYRAFVENSCKRSELFEAYYGVDGINEVSDTEYKAFLKDKYTRVKMIAVSLKDAEGNLLQGSDKQDKLDYAKELSEKITVDTFDEIYIENYNKVNSEKAEATDTEYTPYEYNPEEFENYAVETLLTDDYGMSESFMKTVKNMGNSSVKVIEEADKVYVVLKLNILDREDKFEEEGKLTELQSMKGDEFEELVDKWTADNTGFVWNEEAYERYAPKKIKVS